MLNPRAAPISRVVGPTASLLAACLLVVLVWGWMLPSLSTHPKVKQRLDFLETRGIDPSAMYYTELEAMDEILAHREGTAANAPISTQSPPRHRPSS